MSETTASVQPPFGLYRLEVRPATRNSPSEPAVRLLEVDQDGDLLRVHTLTPEQAGELGQGLINAAELAVYPRIKRETTGDEA